MLKSIKKLNPKKIPGPPDVPFLGNLWRYKLGLEEQGKYHQALSVLNQKYGPVVRQRLGAETVIHVFNPKDVSYVYSKEGKTPSIKPLQETIQYFRKQANTSLGLGNTNGEEWYRLRNALKPIMLTKSGIQHFTEGTDEVTNKLIDRIKKQKNNDNSVPRLMLLFGAWSMEAAGLMCFGKRLGFLEENEKEVIPLLRANRSLFYLSTHLKFSTLLYRHFSSPKWKCLEECETYVMRKTIAYTNEAVDRMKASLDEGKLEDDTHYLLQQLLSNDSISRKDIHILIQSLFTDSLSTTIPVLTFCLYIMAHEPHIQEKTYAEISKFVPKDAVITSKILDKLSYTKGLIKESLRVYPNGTEISRVLHQDLELSGYHVPAETHVNLNMIIHFRNEKEFKDASKVMPERWVRSENIPKSDPIILTPFGFGSRTCMGRRFAEQSLQLAIAKILHNFKIKYRKDAESIQQVYNLLNFPTDTRGLILEPRNN